MNATCQGIARGVVPVRPGTGEPACKPVDGAGASLVDRLLQHDANLTQPLGVIAGEEEGMRSDTTFVVHVSGDRTRMEVVSIPRDSLVTIPACNLTNGSTTKVRQNAMFNEAFQIGAGNDDDMVGAAACSRPRPPVRRCDSRRIAVGSEFSICLFGAASAAAAESSGRRPPPVEPG